MSAVLTPAPAAALPRPLLWTVAEFHRVNASGVWKGRRPMLIRGVILEQGPMNPPHATGVELASDALRTAFGAGWRVRVQLPLVVRADGDPMPDVAVVAGSPRDFAQSHPTTAALVVEVSDTTLAVDSTEKAEDYAAAGVPEYWIVDLNGRRLHVLRDPAPHPAGGHSYRTQVTLGPGDAVSPLAVPAASVAVADLLP
jgi:Uma2 family endonuclease